jgi:hypothetical protein
MIYYRLIAVLFCLFCFSCKTEDTSKNRESATNDSADTTIDYNENVPAFINDTIDTVINNVYTRSYYDLLQSVSVNNNNYRIYAYYAHINDTFYFNKCLRHILVTKNNQVVKKLYEFKKLEENLIGNNFRGDNFRKCQHIVKIVEINTSPHKTFTIILQYNQRAAGAFQYAFLRFNNGLYYSDVFNLFGNLFNSKETISSEDGTFYITLDNHYFPFKIPIKLINKSNNYLMPTLDTSKLIVNDHFVVIDFDKTMHVNTDDTTTIRLYDSYNSSEVSNRIPVNQLNDIHITKAAKYFEDISIINTEKFLKEFSHGIYKGYKERKTVWFIYIETKKFKGWINNYEDILKIGFAAYG